MYKLTLYSVAVLLTATQAAADLLYVSSYDGKVTTLNLTSVSGPDRPRSIKAVATSKGCGDNPSWLQLDHSAAVLYCIDEGFETGGSLSSLRTNEDGTLTSLNKVSTKVSPVSGVKFGIHGFAMAH